MKDHRPRHMRHPLLRAGDRWCVWMEAGLVSYKICDHNGECAACPLDMALGGVRGSSEAADLATEYDRVDPMTFPEDRRYHRCHCWVMQAEGGVTRCGLDAFAANLFSEVSRVILPGDHARLQQGMTSCWVGHGDGVLTPICAPLDGHLVRRNPRLSHTPSLLCMDPYGQGWLYELAGEGDAAGNDDGLGGGADMARQACEDRVALGQRIEAEASLAHAGLGRVAADGGEIFPRIANELGAQKFKEIVEPFLF